MSKFQVDNQTFYHCKYCSAFFDTELKSRSHYLTEHQTDMDRDYNTPIQRIKRFIKELINS